MKPTLSLIFGLMTFGLIAAPTSAPAGALNPAVVYDQIAAFQKSFPGAEILPAGIQPTALPTKPIPVQAPRPSPSASNVRPDFTFTPGRLCTASDPDFQEYRYPEHIPYCKRNVTQQMKQEIAAHYGVPQSEWPNYEFDHLIPLAAGGDSNVDNLWPQPIAQAKVKDLLENQLFQEMQAGTITQAEAVRQIYAWFGVTHPSSPIMPHPTMPRRRQ